MNFIKKHKNIIIYILTIVISVALLIIGFIVCKPTLLVEQSSEHIAYSAKVISIDNVVEDSYSLGGGNDIKSKEIEFTAKITSFGSLKGIEVTAYQYIDGLIAVNPKEVEAGDGVLINYLRNGGDDVELTWTFTEYYRSGGLLVLLAVFFALIIIFGKKKGVNTIISLIFTCLAIFAVFVPSLLKGYNVYLMAILTSVFIIFMTLLLVNGFNIKTICAIAGNIGGLAVAGLLTVIMDYALHLTGVVDEQALYLMMLNPSHPIDLKGIIFGAVVIGALGATMDVAMSIASALHELAENMDNKNFKTMMRSGINIGRDAMSTMTNTLVLAYIGSSLSVVLLIVGSGQSLLTVFNLEMIVVEVLQALVGSIGILVTLPVTSFLAAYLYNRKKKVKVIESEGSALEKDEA